MRQYSRSGRREMSACNRIDSIGNLQMPWRMWSADVLRKRSWVTYQGDDVLESSQDCDQSMYRQGLEFCGSQFRTCHNADNQEDQIKPGWSVFDSCICHPFLTDFPSAMRISRNQRILPSHVCHLLQYAGRIFSYVRTASRCQSEKHQRISQQRRCFPPLFWSWFCRWESICITMRIPARACMFACSCGGGFWLDLLREHACSAEIQISGTTKQIAREPNIDRKSRMQVNIM